VWRANEKLSDRFDVLIHSEQILRIVRGLDLGQSVLILSVCEVLLALVPLMKFT